jgi:hypothetical protein
MSMSDEGSLPSGITDEEAEDIVDSTDDAGTDEPDYEPGQKRPIDHGTKIRGKVKRGTGTPWSSGRFSPRS